MHDVYLSGYFYLTLEEAFLNFDHCFVIFSADWSRIRLKQKRSGNAVNDVNLDALFAI